MRIRGENVISPQLAPPRGKHSEFFIRPNPKHDLGASELYREEHLELFQENTSGTNRTATPNILRENRTAKVYMLNHRKH